MRGERKQGAAGELHHRGSRKAQTLGSGCSSRRAAWSTLQARLRAGRPSRLRASLQERTMRQPPSAACCSTDVCGCPLPAVGSESCLQCYTVWQAGGDGMQDRSGEGGDASERGWYMWRYSV